MFLNWLIPRGISIGSSLITFARAVRVAAALTVTGAFNAAAATLSGVLTLSSGQYVKGSRFTVTFSSAAAPTAGMKLFVAPVACKVISAYESHGVVCDAADVGNIEKLNTGEAAGAGDVVLATGFTLNSTINTPVTRAAVAGEDAPKASLIAGDSLAWRYTTGDGTDTALVNLTITLEVL